MEDTTEHLSDDTAGDIGNVDRESLLRRLNRIEGQLRGIRRMVEEPRPCIDVLQQLAAAEAALGRIGLAVFKHHVDHCIAPYMTSENGDGRKNLDELVAIFDRFGK
jgi:DNA-binding FrmR family transcriptional regulator